MDQEVFAAKRTALYEEHVALGARLVDFAGWQMPMFYSGIVREHKMVRSTAGIFDVSHMGEFEVSGPDAVRALERLMTNRVASLKDGGVRYTAMCYEDGGVVDDLLVYSLPDRYILVVNAANRIKDYQWIEANLEGDVVLRDVSDQTALVALQGPASEEVLKPLADTELPALAYYNSTDALVAGKAVLLSRTGYTGEDGFEIYCRPEDAREIWRALLDSGQRVDIGPVGLGARDTLRLEMGYNLYGSEMGPDRTPAEAGLMWVTKLDKGGFIGREAIQRVLDEGAGERIVGFELTERGVPRNGQRIMKENESVGVVTSGTFSPSLERGIGLGYLRHDVSEGIAIEIRGKQVAARLTSPPFYREGSVKSRRR